MSDERQSIPVILKFSKVAANANLNVTLTTEGVYWSLGANSADSLGLSYNVMETNDGTESCIQKIEFNNAILSLLTSSSASPLNDFTLTLHLHVAAQVHALSGHCTLNNEATLMVNFGSDRAVEWRNGRISALLNKDSGRTYSPVLLAIKGLLPSNNVSVAIDTDPRSGKVSWSLGENLPAANGMVLSSTSSHLPLSLMSFGQRQIVFESAAQSNPAGVDFVMLAHVYSEPSASGDIPEFIYLKTSSNSRAATVYAQVGSRQPQLVGDTFTLFRL
jgi:hypothetical protein